MRCRVTLGARASFALGEGGALGGGSGSVKRTSDGMLVGPGPGPGSGPGGSTSSGVLSRLLVLGRPSESVESAVSFSGGWTGLGCLLQITKQSGWQGVHRDGKGAGLEAVCGWKARGAGKGGGRRPLRGAREVCLGIWRWAAWWRPESPCIRCRL